MNEHFFEMLLNLFEKTLDSLKKSNASTEKEASFLQQPSEESDFIRSLVVKKASPATQRVYLDFETHRLTKAAYQFFIQFSRLDLVQEGVLELVLHQLNYLQAPIIGIEELKWAIRHGVSDIFTRDQLAFLDLVLYKNKSQSVLH